MSDWIPHDGGKCPVAPDTLVNVAFRCGTKELVSYSACAYRWKHIDEDADIVAYRVVNAPVDREFRRAVFLAVLPVISKENMESAIRRAWEYADEAIAQEGA